jgi:signal transduction histidine kinase
LRGTRSRYRLDGVPLIDGAGRFAGFRGHATSIVAEDTALEPEPEDGTAFGQRLDQALRVPLDRIISQAETIGAQPDGPLGTDYAGYATDIASAGRHLLALVDDLVDLQAIERPDFQPEADELDLADVARRAAGLLSVRASGHKVTVDCPAEGEAVPARGEFKRALQVMMNLITNAIRYSPEGGMIWIRADSENGVASVVVADQGKGVAPEDQARIFEKFERVDPLEPGGTGLGLYIARRLARAMGGDISVDSAPGQGARFTFTLPALSPAALPSRRTRRRARPSVRSRRGRAASGRRKTCGGSWGQPRSFPARMTAAPLNSLTWQPKRLKSRAVPGALAAGGGMR